LVIGQVEKHLVPVTNSKRKRKKKMQTEIEILESRENPSVLWI